MAGAKTAYKRGSSRKRLRPDSLEIITSSTGHRAGVRTVGSKSVCLCAGTKRMCPAGMRTSVDMLGCPRIEAAFHGVSSQTGRTSTTRSGVGESVDDASA
jgi:hypothetical protein